MDFSYLTTIIFLPVVGAILIAFIPGLSARVIKRIAAVFTFVPLALSIYLFSIFDRSSAAAGTIQFEEKLSWIPAINAHYHVGVDGLSIEKDAPRGTGGTSNFICAPYPTLV